MKERGILFSGEMVRSILDGRKTQTRRVVKPQPNQNHHIALMSGQGAYNVTGKPQFEVLTHYARTVETIECPYGQRGDRLWVKEAWGLLDTEPKDGPEGATVGYKADGDAAAPNGQYQKWRPSIFMPRWASRITLEIAKVRVERVQKITPGDAASEGAQYPVVPSEKHPGMVVPLMPLTDKWLIPHFPKPREMTHDSLLRANFAALWDGINSKRGFGWEKNPWVWVIEFSICKPQ